VRIADYPPPGTDADRAGNTRFFTPQTAVTSWVYSPHA